jgi:hypothetical protein
MQKRGVICGAISSTLFGAITLLAFFNDKVNRLFAKPLGLLAYPIERIFGKIIKDNNSYLVIALAVDLIYMLIIGFFAGFVFYRLVFRSKETPESPFPPK